CSIRRGLAGGSVMDAFDLFGEFRSTSDSAHFAACAKCDAMCQRRHLKMLPLRRAISFAFYRSRLRRSKSAASLSLDARLSNDLSPFGAFGPEQGSSLIRRIADCLEAKRRHFLHDVRQRDDLDDLAMEQRGNLLRW